MPIVLNNSEDISPPICGLEMSFVFLRLEQTYYHRLYYCDIKVEHYDGIGDNYPPSINLL